MVSGPGHGPGATRRRARCPPRPAGNTNFGGLVTRTASVTGLLDATTMGAFRIQQNVLEESTAGVIATVGDPEGRAGSYLLGTDFTFQTSRFGGDKNLLVGAWGLITGREGLTGDRTAFGAMIDYPNDVWDLSATFQRIGDGFDPSMGFVPRRGIYRMTGGGGPGHPPRSRPSSWV